MHKRFSDEQIIGFLCEAEAGASVKGNPPICKWV